MTATSPALEWDSANDEGADGRLAETRVCGRCLERLPSTAFRPRSRGSDKRHSVCRCCYRDYVRERRRQQRRRRFDAFTSNAVRVAQTSNAAAVSALVREVVREFGGVAKMAAVWKGAVADAEAHGRSCSVLRSFRAFFAMNEALQRLQAEEDAAEAARVGRMSLEDVEREKRDLVRRTIQAEPQLAVWAAAVLGWQIRPPEGGEFVRL